MTRKQREIVVSRKIPKATDNREQRARVDRLIEGMQVLTWIVAFTLIALANALWVILRSFFKTILPTKRNLLTYLDEVLVMFLALTCSFEVLIRYSED